VYPGAGRDIRISNMTQNTMTPCEIALDALEGGCLDKLAIVMA